MRKSEAYAIRIRSKYGKDWMLNPLFRKPYDSLVAEENLQQTDELTEKIESLETLVEESFSADENAEVRDKFLETLESLRLKIIASRVEKTELNEKTLALLEKMEKNANSWETEREKFFILTEALGEAIKDANETSASARKANEIYNAEVKILKDATLKYNKLTIELNSKYQIFNKKVRKFNLDVKRLNKMRA